MAFFCLLQVFVTYRQASKTRLHNSLSEQGNGRAVLLKYQVKHTVAFLRWYGAVVNCPEKKKSCELIVRPFQSGMVK